MVRFLQPPKASSSITLTEDGMVISLILVSEKAYSPILVTPSFITTLSTILKRYVPSYPLTESFTDSPPTHSFIPSSFSIIRCPSEFNDQPFPLAMFCARTSSPANPSTNARVRANTALIPVFTCFIICILLLLFDILTISYVFPFFKSMFPQFIKKK